MNKLIALVLMGLLLIGLSATALFADNIIPNHLISNHTIKGDIHIADIHMAQESSYGPAHMVHTVRGDSDIGKEGTLNSRKKRALKNMGATDSQIEMIEELMRSNYESQSEARETLQELQTSIQNELYGDNPNGETLERLVREAASVRTDLTLAGINTQLQVREIVGAEVWGKMTDKAHRGHHRGNSSKRRKR